MKTLYKPDEGQCYSGVFSFSFSPTLSPFNKGKGKSHYHLDRKLSKAHSMLKDRSGSSSTTGAVLCVDTHTRASEPQQFSTFLNPFGQLLLYLHSNVRPASYFLYVYTYLANKAILTPYLYL